MLWINRDFFLLWSGQLISQLGDKFYSIALAWWILEKTNSSSVMGIFLLFSILPEMLFGPIAGGFIDRWNRKYIIIVTDLIRGCIVLTMTIFLFKDMLQVWHVFIGVSIISLCSAFFNPTIMALIPQVVNQGEITKANSLSQLISGFSSVLGPVAGATFVSILGYNFVFLLNGGSYLFSAFFASLMVVSVANKRSTSGFGKEILEGFHLLYKNQRIYVIAVIIGIAHIFYGSLVVALPFIANSLSGEGIKNMGYLEGAIGIGMIFGVFLLQFKGTGKPKGHMLFWALLAMGVFFALLGSGLRINLNHLIPYLLLVMLIGGTVTIASVLWRSLIQLNVADTISGRIFSLCNTIANITLPLAMAFFGVLMEIISIDWAILFSGMGLIIISAFLLLKYRSIY